MLTDELSFGILLAYAWRSAMPLSKCSSGGLSQLLDQWGRGHEKLVDMRLIDYVLMDLRLPRNDNGLDLNGNSSIGGDIKARGRHGERQNSIPFTLSGCYRLSLVRGDETKIM